MKLSVWAPHAQRVDLVTDLFARPAEAGDGGWFAVDLTDDEVGPHFRYRWSLDGGSPLPDPRSARQPEGVHGASAVVNHATFPWTDDAWRGLLWSSSVVYELHIGTFTTGGTFVAAIDRLNHLVDLGVTAVEVMPIAAFPGDRGWGYDGVFLFAPHESYGGPDGFKALVDACHSRGLGVVLDVVYNHLGPDGNVLGAFGPYFTDVYVTPWGAAVNFAEADSDEVRKFVVDNALTWLQHYHVDGLRLDATHAIVDPSAVPVLEELAAAVAGLSAHLGVRKFLVAENAANDPRLVRAVEAGGFGLDASWNDDFHHAIHAAFTGEQSGYYADYPGGLDEVTKALRDGYVLDGRWSPTRRRHHGRPFGELARTHLVGFLQNHDQIGNRAVGDRLSQLTTVGRLRVGAALLLLGPFVPLLFQGEEWGATTPFQYFTDHVDPGLGHSVSEGRRREFAAFGWSADDVPDPQNESTFLVSKLDWGEVGREEHAGLVEWHRSLIALRHEEVVFTDGGAGRNFEAWADEEVLTMVRGPFRIIANLGDEAVLDGVEGATLILRSHADVRCDDDELTLPRDSVGVLRFS